MDGAVALHQWCQPLQKTAAQEGSGIGGKTVDAIAQ